MSTVKRVLDIALAEQGVKESPAGSNRTKYGAWYGMNGQPWCAIFVSWVLAQAGIPLPITTPKGFAYCPYGVDWFKRQGAWHTANPQRGDIVFFDWHPGTARSGAYHVGIVVAVHADGSVDSIEGNTAPPGGSQDNGGQVLLRRRPKSVILGFGRPRYQAEASAPAVPALHPIDIILPDGQKRPGWLIESAGRAETWVRLNDLQGLGITGIWDGQRRQTTIRKSDSG